MARIFRVNEDVLYKIKVEDDLAKSFFAPEYDKALEELKEIVEANKHDRNNKEEDLNNIIAFIGDRGTGKTSVMTSFKKSICNRCKKEDKFPEKKWNSVDTIDPSMLSSKDSILEVIIGSMFQKFREYEECRDYNSKQQVVKNFESVYRDLSVINKDTKFNDNIDSLEKLLDLSSGLNLKANMVKLVDSYLEYMGDMDFIVIPIDDIDLNLTLGMEMIEEIRKYLMIPKVVILMAIKIEQLEQIIMQKHLRELSEYKKNYIDLLEGKEKENFYSEIKNKTEKYLEKTIPYTRRIILPYLDEVEHEVKLEGKFQKLSQINKGTNPSITIDEVIKKTMYNKLRYIIYSDKHYRAITPKTLRGYIQLLDVLNSMKDIEESKENYKYNINIFKQYYRNILLNEISNYDNKKFLSDIIYYNIEIVNRKILIYINGLIRGIYNNLISGESEELPFMKEIFSDINEFYKRERLIRDTNLGLGYVITWIRLYDVSAIYSEEIKFVELLKLVYSIRLIEYSVLKSEDINNIIGNDFLGRFLEVEKNKHANKFIYEVKKNKDFDEALKSNDENIKLFYNIFEPKYTSQEHSSRNDVIYREDINVLDTKDSMDRRIRYYFFKPFKIIGFILNNDKDKECMNYILNIDLFMHVLIEFSKEVGKLRYKSISGNEITKLVDDSIAKYNLCVKNIMKNCVCDKYTDVVLSAEQKGFIKTKYTSMFNNNLDGDIKNLINEIEICKKNLETEIEKNNMNISYFELGENRKDIKLRDKKLKEIIDKSEDSMKKIIKDFYQTNKWLSEDLKYEIEEFISELSKKQTPQNQYTKPNYIGKLEEHRDFINKAIEILKKYKGI